MKIQMIDEMVQHRLTNELHTYRQALSNASKHFNAIEKWEAFQESAEKYVKLQVNDISNGNAESLNLGASKLAEIYNINLMDLELLREVITDSKFYECVRFNGSLELDEEIAESIITQHSSIEYTKPQMDFLKALQGLEASYKKVIQIGGGGTGQMFATNMHGDITPNTALIKYYIR